MSEVHKIMCDAKGCNNEKDMLSISFGNDWSNWQELHHKDNILGTVIKHACCSNCAINVLKGDK